MNLLFVDFGVSVTDKPVSTHEEEDRPDEVFKTLLCTCNTVPLSLIARSPMVGVDPSANWI